MKVFMGASVKILLRILIGAIQKDGVSARGRGLHDRVDGDRGDPAREKFWAVGSEFGSSPTWAQFNPIFIGTRLV
jgi:hypothetical protein